MMKDKTIIDIAESYGLTVEAAIVHEHERAFRVYKGANQIFIGTEEAVREFLSNYEKTRPALFEESMINYKE
jgi:hypothetical protein